MNTSDNRVFLAIELPVSIRAYLSRLYDHGEASIRWTRRNDLHLTLRYIGQTENDVVQRIASQLETVQVSPFALEIRDMGAFPSNEDPSIVWVGVGSGHPNLFELRKKVDDAILQIGIDNESREFVPHITLGRCGENSRDAVEKYLEAKSDRVGPMFTVRGFTLFESVMETRGPKYRTIQQFKLS